jgi:hypothetical protein
MEAFDLAIQKLSNPQLPKLIATLRRTHGIALRKRIPMQAHDPLEDSHRKRSNFVRGLVQRSFTPIAAFSESASKPPQRIVQFWDDLNRLPVDVGECIATWKKAENQGFERLLFDKHQAREFIHQRLGQRYKEAYDKCYHPAMQSDYFRLSYIFVEGGCYIDADDVYHEAPIQHICDDGRLKLQPLCYDMATNMMVADVLNEPGNRYTLIYGLADPTFPKNAPFSRFSDSGKLMALASFSTRCTASAEETKLMDFLLVTPHVQLSMYKDIERVCHYNVGVDDQEFRNFAGIFSDKVFDIFYRFAKANMKKKLPLLIAGGCGLNCDWNTKWKESGLFPEVFVPPVANDSGSAIGTAIDAQFYYTGNPKIDWNVYSGLDFDTTGSFDMSRYDLHETDDVMIADMLAHDLILGWVNGKYEIGPRALGNRSILAAPFQESTRTRLNEIKQREQFRPIAPVCLEEDAARWFGCDHTSPHILYTYRVSKKRRASGRAFTPIAWAKSETAQLSFAVGPRVQSRGANIRPGGTSTTGGGMCLAARGRCSIKKRLVTVIFCRFLFVAICPDLFALKAA